jgi:hypothetical protein
MSSAARAIRFAILCEQTVFPAWQARAIKQLLEHPQIHLTLLIMEAPLQDAREHVASRSLLWRLYQRYYLGRKAKAYQAEDLGPLLAEVPRLEYRRSGSESEVKAIRDVGLDFILQLGSRRPNAELLQAARSGVWAFYAGDEQCPNTTPAGFWEIYRNKLVTMAGLHRLTDDPGRRIVLQRGVVKTKISHPKNVDQILFEAARWPLQSCIDIFHNQLDQRTATAYGSGKAGLATPTNPEMLSFMVRLVQLTVRKAFKSLFYTDFWNIGVAEVPIQRFLDTASPPPVKWFPNLPKSKFIADPFGIKQGDRLHIVYEDFRFDEGIGTIGTLAYGAEGFSKEQVEINEPFHLSYPFTFEHENQIYAIPESYQAKQVRLYKALDFPHRWAFDRILIDGYAGIDNTLFFQDDLWWMFSTDKDDGVHHNLKIHYAQDLFGPWHPHPKNPVKTDIRAARPAGSIFTHEGAIFRPSMDYSEKVEGRITLNRILTLSTTDFEEEVHGVINPFPDTFYSDKVHTLCAAENFTIVDGAKELFIFDNIHVLRYQLNKQWHKMARRMGIG